MKEYWNRFRNTLSFMTTLPAGSTGGFDENFNKAPMFFPWVGFVLGLLIYGVGILFYPLFGSVITGILVVALEALLTGGLHLDGLGDTFDGLYSYRDRERIFEIMKDSRLGTNGLLAILFLLLLKISLISQLLSLGAFFPLLIMPVAGRTVSLFQCYVGKPAKPEGMANVFISKVPKSSFWFGIVSTLVILEIFSWVHAEAESSFVLLGINLLATGLCILFSIIYARDVNRRIGGLTGDILGALCEMAELIYLFAITILLFFWR